MVQMSTWSFLRSFWSTTKNLASIHWSILVAVACTLWLAIRMESEKKKFERCLLYSSQLTSTHRRLQKCYGFQFITFKFFNKLILCLFSWSFDDMYLRKKIFVNIFKSCFCCMYFLHKAVKFWLPLAVTRFVRKI